MSFILNKIKWETPNYRERTVGNADGGVISGITVTLYRTQTR